MHDLAVILIVVFSFCVFLRFLDSVQGATSNYCGPLYCFSHQKCFYVHVMLLKTSIENKHFCLLSWNPFQKHIHREDQRHQLLYQDAGLQQQDFVQPDADISLEAEFDEKDKSKSKQTYLYFKINTQAYDLAVF